MMKKLVLFAVAVSLNSMAFAEDILLKDIALDTKRNIRTWAVPEIKLETSRLDGAVAFTLVENHREKTEKNFAQVWLSEDLALEPGKRYRLNFILKSTQAVTLHVNVMQDFRPNNHLVDRKIILSKDTPQAISLTINTSKAHNGRLRVPNIFLGTVPTGTTLELSSVKLFEIK